MMKKTKKQSGNGSNESMEQMYDCDNEQKEGSGIRTVLKKDTLDLMYGNKETDVTGKHRLLNSASFTDVSSLYRNDEAIMTGAANVGMDEVLWEQKEDLDDGHSDIGDVGEIGGGSKATMISISVLNEKSDSEVMTADFKNEISCHLSGNTPGK